MTKKYSMSVGNDIGNSEADVYIDGKLVRQPNVFSSIGQLPWKDDDIDVQKNLKNIFDNLVVSIISPAVPTGMYTVGNHALKTNGENVTSLYVKGNGSKADQLVPYINTLAFTAARAIQKAYSEGGNLNDAIEVEADMAAALPVKQSSPTNSMKLRQKFMLGSHLVTVHLGLTKSVTVKIQFHYVHVLQEGTPVVFALQMNSIGDWRTTSYNTDEVETVDSDLPGMFDEFAATYELGDIDGSYFDGKNILHLDMGDGTTDTPLTRGDAVDNDFGDGINSGIGHAISAAIPDLITLAPHAFNSITRQQYSEILKSQFSNKKHKFLNEALQAFNPHCDNQANQIVHHTNDQILKIGANEIDIVVAYGGGSILMKPTIYDKLKTICDNTRIQLFYVPAEYAVTLNGEGLDYFVRSPIYEALKMKFLSSPEYVSMKKVEENKKSAVKQTASTKE
ncbi:ParM/StbA family protein [Paenibacillus sp. AGC30]